MTLNTTPLWLQGSSSHTANMYRRWLDWMTNQKSGIFALGDFAVSQHSPANMTVDVAPGLALVRGTEDATYQGMYLVDGQSVENVSVSAAHATLNRIDLIGIRIRDNAYSTGPSNDATIISVTGTPASSPSAPTAPPNFFLLATVSVAAAATTVVTANITNLRTTTTGQGYAGLRGAYRRCVAAARPSTNLQDYADFIIESDTGRQFVYDGTRYVPTGPTGLSTYQASYNTTTSLASSGATLTLPPGRWFIQAKGEAANLAAAATQLFQMQLWNATGAAQLDTTSLFFGSAVLARQAWSCFAPFTNTANATIQLRAMSTTGGANYPIAETRLWATSVGSTT